jgi:tRNA-Thr(GGU) m(6)t(6)A37 methyltransferase TsaA
MTDFQLRPIGQVHSTLRERKGAPRQPDEGAPPARLEIFAEFLPALDGVVVGDDMFVFTWLHEGKRDVLQVYPRGQIERRLTGVFATRSPDRPNPVGLHRVRLLAIDPAGWLDVEALEVIDGTPIIDLKPVLSAGDR